MPRTTETVSEHLNQPPLTKQTTTACNENKLPPSPAAASTDGSASPAYWPLAGALVAYWQKHKSPFPIKVIAQAERNPHRRLQNFHLSRRRPPLLPPPPRRGNLPGLQPPLHPSHLPGLLSPRRKHLRLPLPRRHLFRHQRRSSRRPTTKAAARSNPRTPRQQHRRDGFRRANLDEHTNPTNLNT